MRLNKRFDDFLFSRIIFIFADCNVKIKNVHSSAFCTIVRLLNQSGIKLHDVEIDGVYDTYNIDSPHMKSCGLYAVRVGDNRLYGTRHSTVDETYNISIKNITGAGRQVVSLAGSTKNLTLENISAIGNTPLLLDERINKLD